MLDSRLHRALRTVHPFVRSLGMARGLIAPRPRACQPPQLLELFSLEGCGACRRVREVLTELDLDYVHRSCPVGDERNRATVLARGGRTLFPYLIDPNAGVELYESREIVRYLQHQYGPEPEGARLGACGA